jgi:hypothetical protein
MMTATRPPLLVGIGFAMFWVSILAHEAGHLGVAAAAYSTVHLGELPDDAALWVVSAGPLVTWAILLACGLAVTVQRRDSVRKLWIALGMGAASRIAFVGPGTLLGTAVNDERTVSGILGVSARLVWMSEAVVGALILSWMISQLTSGTRWWTTGWMLIGTSIGWGSALTFGRWIGLRI